ncbi:MAG: glycosyltransferase family 4 protein [Treponema sp.]|nr:glycosyltransferase family 4 protein [Treponema sp.]
MNKSELRKKYGYDEKDFILIYIAEFIPRKNHEFLLRSIDELRKKIPELKILLVGRGVLLKKMKHLTVDLEIDDIVKFLGYRKDIADLCRASDIYVSVSLQEGLPVSVIEAMACGLPIVASDIRGHRDNVVDGENGFLFALGDSKRMCDGVFDIYNSMELHERFSRNSVEFAKKYDLKSIRLKMAKIYDEVESRFL